jgi:hypothetical protein
VVVDLDAVVEADGLLRTARARLLHSDEVLLELVEDVGAVHHLVDAAEDLLADLLEDPVDELGDVRDAVGSVDDVDDLEDEVETHRPVAGDRGRLVNLRELELPDEPLGEVVECPLVQAAVKEADLDEVREDSAEVP